MGNTISIPGSTKVDITVFGRGTVIAGSGNDKIDITGYGKIVVGAGNDTLALGHGGVIDQYGLSGHDTIHVGSTGNYIINEQGSATVSGAFGHATITHATLEIFQSNGQERIVVLPYGHDTVQGSGAGTQGSGAGKAGTGHDSLTGAGAHTTVAGSGGTTHHLVDWMLHQKGHVIKNFVAGESHVFIDGHTLPFLMNNVQDMAGHGPSKVFSMDGGRTTIHVHVPDFHGSNH